ncbi:hypothetical protein Pmani_012558 [Petrolisthes manimaculis]|uniref:PI31 proteasome regulator N-terminal domain-containing protein n=1 Tax=Petrolisthes manimaculis TaxID=1843537 RepID=A0AAE1UEI3_9EUCA|nr:hypothetical protein Pmani_012558 [Petrolisthes manimaculis]
MEAKPSLLVEVRDGEAPTWLHEKMSHYKPTCDSQAINLLLHFTMTECGFECKGDDIGGPPSGWQDRFAIFMYNSRAFPIFECVLVLMTKTGVKQIVAYFPDQEDELDFTYPYLRPYPHPVPDPFFDPDSPYFQGEVPPMQGAFPEVPDPLGPLGPLGPPGPFRPRFRPPRPRNPRGPRFDYL